MRTVTITLFAFDELGENARSKVLKTLRTLNVDDPDWHERVLRRAKDDLAAAGFRDADIRYTGFWSQGDGASFTARVDLAAWLRGAKLASRYRALARDADAASVRITRSGFYSHEYTMGIEAWYAGDSAAAEAQLEDLREDILEDARGRALAIYRSLEREYEEQTGDEQVIEAIRALGQEFTEDGSPAEAWGL